MARRCAVRAAIAPCQPSRDDGDRGGYGHELLARVQPDRPVMIEVVGSADDHGDLVGSDPATVHLPAPGPVVLDLPGQRPTGGGVVDHGRGQDLPRRPGRGADRRAVGSRLEVPVSGGDPAESFVVPQPYGAPAILRAPAVLRRVQHQVIERFSVVEDAAQGQRADHLHDPLVVGGVPNRAASLQSRHVGVRGERGAGRQAGRVVALLDDQPGGPVVDDGPVRDVAQPVTDTGAGEACVVEGATIAQHQQLDQWLAGRRGPLVPRHVQAVDRHGSVVADPDHDADLRVPPADARHGRRTYSTTAHAFHQVRTGISAGRRRSGVRCLALTPRVLVPLHQPGHAVPRSLNDGD